MAVHTGGGLKGLQYLAGLLARQAREASGLSSGLGLGRHFLGWTVSVVNKKAGLHGLRCHTLCTDLKTAMKASHRAGQFDGKGILERWKLVDDEKTT